jgi:hypothetical protein
MPLARQSLLSRQNRKTNTRILAILAGRSQVKRRFLMRLHPLSPAALGCGLALLLTASFGIAQQPEPKQPPAPLLPDGLRHVPADAMGFVHFRAADFLKSAVGKALLQELQADREAATGLKKIEQTLGVDATNLQSVTLLILMPPSRPQINLWDVYWPPRTMPSGRDRDFEMKRKFDMEKRKLDLDLKLKLEELELRRREEEALRRKFEDEEKKKLEERKNQQRKAAEQEFPVLFQEGELRRLFELQDIDPRIFQSDGMDPWYVGDPFAYTGTLVIVTSTKPLDRKTILRSQLFAAKPRDIYAPAANPSVLFLGDRTVMIGTPWDLARYSELMARNPGPKAKPMQSTLTLAANPHLLVAAGHLPAEMRGTALFPFGPQMRLFAAISPLFQTEATLALDLGKSLDVTLQFEAPTQASAANALQAVKTLRVLAELAIEKSREVGESGGVKLELEKGAIKALADATIDQKDTLVTAQLKMEVRPAVLKHFTKQIVATIRQKGDRAQCVNNLKQIGLAIHSYHDSYKRLPPAAFSSVNDPTGKPLLSWRVAILPFIEQENLYKQFDLNKPWDHPTNKKLIRRMPPIYLMPGVDAKDGHTHYRVLVGPDTLLEPIKGPGGRLMSRYNLGNIPDGSSNTILVVEAKEPTIWTRPDDLPYDPNGPLPKLGTSSDGFHAVLGDGSVRFIPSTISERTLRAAITCSDGLPLGADWYR